MSLKDNRKLHFAVGLTAIVIAIRWLLTGDLLLAVEAAKPPAEGETKSIALLSVLGPMLIEACVIVGASIIAWSLKLWHWLASVVDRSVDQSGDKANQVRADPAAMEPVMALAPMPSPVATAAVQDDTASRKTTTVEWIDPQSLVAALAQAVAIGDAEAEAECRKEIRKPYLRVELSESISTANYARAREIITELETMTAVPAVAAIRSTRRTKNNSGASSHE